MDALSVAAAVVAFVDFGVRVASKTFEIRGSVAGQPVEVVGLASSSSYLSSLASTAKHRVENLGSSYSGQAESLGSLVAECASVEVKLEDALKKLTVKPTSHWTRKGQVFVVSIRSVWKEKDVEALGRQLDRIRNQVMMNVVMCVW